MRTVIVIVLSLFLVSPVLADAGVDALVLADHAEAAGSAAVVAPIVVPDPLAAPVESVSMLTKLYKSGAWIGLGILIAFFALSIAAKKVAWLKEGKRAVYCSAALGGLALLAVPASQGSTPNAAMFLAAAIAAVTLALNPTKPGEA
jgi:hypothetical protein